MFVGLNHGVDDVHAAHLIEKDEKFEVNNKFRAVFIIIKVDNMVRLTWFSRMKIPLASIFN